MMALLPAIPVKAAVGIDTVTFYDGAPLANVRKGHKLEIIGSGVTAGATLNVYWDDAFKDARKAAFKKAKGESIGAGAAVSEAASSASAEDKETLAKELLEIQTGKRGDARSPENVKRRKEIREKLASKGH